MLGLGGNLMSSSFTESDTLLASYSSDFSSGADGWVDYSVEGALTYTGGQTPLYASGTGQWLKIAYDTTQTSLSGIKRANFAPAGPQVGDYLIVSYDIFIEEEGDGFWDAAADDDDVGFRVQMMGQTSGVNIAVDTETSVGPVTLTGTVTTRDLLFEFYIAADRPQLGAVYYIKNVAANLYRPLS